MKIKKILESFTSGFRSSIKNDSSLSSSVSPNHNAKNITPLSNIVINNIETPISERKLSFAEIKLLSIADLSIITPKNLMDNISASEKNEISSYVLSKLNTKKKPPNLFDLNSPKISSKQIEDGLPFIRPLMTNKDKKNLLSKQSSVIRSNTNDAQNITNEYSSSSKKKELPTFDTSEPKGQVPIIDRETPSKSSKFSYYSNKANNTKKSLVAFVSYASSPESLQVFLNKQKVTVFINGISHNDEKSSAALMCKNFLNENLKKKNVYLEKLEDLNEHSILANVFFDKDLTINMAVVATKHGFNYSEAKPLSEDDLYIPENKVIAKYTNPNDVKISEYTDTKTIPHNNFDNESTTQAQNQGGNQKGSEKTQTTSQIKETPFEQLFNQHKKNCDKDNQVGLLLEHGPANYQFKEGNTKSYYVKLKQPNKEIILWGQNLPDALGQIEALPGDFLHLSKYTEKNHVNNRTYNFWSASMIKNNLDENLQKTYLEKISPLENKSENKSNIQTNSSKRDNSNSPSSASELNHQSGDKHIHNISQEDSNQPIDDGIPDYITAPIDDSYENISSKEVPSHIDIVSGGMDSLFEQDNPFLTMEEPSVKKPKPK